MSHPYAVQPAKSTGGGIQNGSLIVLVREPASNISSRSPEINKFVDSGVMNIRTSGRFDEYYGGGPTT
jgi:hypothetical protein